MRQQVITVSDVVPQPTRRRVVTLGSSKNKKGASRATEQQVSFKNCRSGKNLTGTLVEVCPG
jgi:hypothetical protein